MTKTQTKLLEALITAGQQCSDYCYFNRPNDTAAMLESAREWEKALQEYRQAQTRQL